jgi:capsule polysaccharide export protein KpsE/RkpR
MVPAEQTNSGSLPGQLGGLAAMAGVNLSSGGIDKTAIALQTIQSRDFISKFIRKHNILVELMAAKGWDRQSNTLAIDESLYSVKDMTWIRNVKAPRKPEPSMLEAYAVFSDMFELSTDSKSGLVTLEFKHYSPFFAKQILDWLVADINQEMKLKDIQEAEKSIVYVEQQISKTNISEVKATLFSLIEEQTKTLMLANSREEYMFKIIDSAFVPELKFEPKRMIIVTVVTFFGGVFGVFVVLLFSVFRHETVNKSLN